jgi:hypothetical protein
MQRSLGVELVGEQGQVRGKLMDMKVLFNLQTWEWMLPAVGKDMNSQNPVSTHFTPIRSLLC